jgi:heme-degrading monooxygenase HmoA
VIIWEFRVTRGAERRFEEAYGPTGDWVRLFQKAPGFLRTELCRDTTDLRRYVTVDYWESRDAYRAFRVRWRSQFDALDERCRALTDHEACLGAFLLLDRSAPGVPLSASAVGAIRATA